MSLLKVTKDNICKKNEKYECLILKIDEQFFAIPVNKIRDVLILQEVTAVPLAPNEIIGLINLRGRIVTGINIRSILGIDKHYNLKNSMSVVVEFEKDLYSLIVDFVGDVITIPCSDINPNPENMDKKWLDISIGIYPNKDDLIVIIDVDKLLYKLY